jgi:hypothetical protein
VGASSRRKLFVVPVACRTPCDKMREHWSQVPSVVLVAVLIRQQHTHLRVVLGEQCRRLSSELAHVVAPVARERRNRKLNYV